MNNFQEIPTHLTFFWLYLLHEKPSYNSDSAAIPQLCFYCSHLFSYTFMI